MPASSNARATPIIATPAPLPPEPTTPIRLPRSAGIGLGSSGGKTWVSIGFGSIDKRERQQRLPRVT